MRVLKVENNRVNIEINYYDVGILHFALYDYLVKVEAKLNQKDLVESRQKRLQTLKDNIQSMVETINGVM